MSITTDITPPPPMFCGRQGKLNEQRARVRAFIEANWGFGGLRRQNRDFDKISDHGTCVGALASYGLPNSDDYARIRRVLCHAAQIKFFVKFVSLSDAPLRSSFRTVCSDDPNGSHFDRLNDPDSALLTNHKTVSELKDVLCGVAKKWENICVPTYRIARALLFAFEDIPLLGADDSRTLMEKAGKDTFAMALKTVGDVTPLVGECRPVGAVYRTILAALPERDANMIKEDMEFMGAVPVARVYAAQNRIQSIACRLILQGKIKLPLAPRNATPNAQCGKTDEALLWGTTKGKNAYDVWEIVNFDAGDVLTEEVRRGIVDCAVSLRAAIRGFILQKAGNKQDEVRAMLGEYSEEADRSMAAAMWEKDYERLKKRVYIRELQGVHKELGHLLCCVPRAKTQEFLDGLEASPPMFCRPSISYLRQNSQRLPCCATCAATAVAANTTGDYDKAIWCAVRWSTLLWSDVHFLNCVDISYAWCECTPTQVSTALVGADDETKRIILDSIAPYDGINLSGESTVKEWRRDVVKREMERLVDEAARHATAEEVEAARDEVLNALVNCESVKQWMLDRVEGYTA